MGFFIVTQSPKAYTALLATGFRPAPAPSTTGNKMFAVHNSPMLRVPDEYADECVITDILCLEAGVADAD